MKVSKPIHIMNTVCILTLAVGVFLSPVYGKSRYTNKPMIDQVVAAQHLKLFAPRLVETPVVPSEYIPLIEKMALPKRKLWKWGR